MDSNENQQTINQLAFNWMKAGLLSVHLNYADYIQILVRLQEATRSLARTSDIFTVVINQARELNMSSEWVEHELRFETLAQFVESRADLLLLDLKQGPVDDDSLDLYNLRASRFALTG